MRVALVIKDDRGARRPEGVRWTSAGVRPAAEVGRTCDAIHGCEIRNSSEPRRQRVYGKLFPMMARPAGEKTARVINCRQEKKVHQTRGMNYSVFVKEFKPTRAQVVWLSC
jgi:hypothetical protein